MSPAPKLYGELAGWFHLLTPPEEYEEEAGIYGRTLEEAAEGPVRTVLELGSGGGNNASYLKRRFDMTLTDLSEEMLEGSRSLNPELEHLPGDMRALRLGREFDAVFAHDAVDYLTAPEDLRACMETAWVHLRPGGVALFVPDYIRESFTPGVDHGGTDRGDRGLRYLEWQWDPDPDDTTYLVDFAYLLREGTEVRAVHDRHVCGLFGRDQWLGLLRAVGFRAEHRPTVLSDGAGNEMFVALKPR
jgi:SAM-dependent methyltransferase